MNKDEALKIFKDKMEFRNLSPKTMKMYIFYLNKYFDFTDKSIDQLTIQDSIDFVVSLKKSGDFTPQSLNVIISMIRCFNELVLDIFVSRAKFPKIRYNHQDPSIFSDEEIKTMLDTDNLKMKTMIFLGIDCGLRVSEVANLRISDIHSKENFILIRESKRSKTRKVKLSSQCLSLLRQYWKVFRPDDYFFPSNRSSKCGLPIVPCTINEMFRAHLQSVGIEKGNRCFHSLRHSYATNMLEDDCDIFVLKKLLGHSSFSSTARYINVTSKDIKSSFSPSDKRGYLQ